MITSENIHKKLLEAKSVPATNAIADELARQLGELEQWQSWAQTELKRLGDVDGTNTSQHRMLRVFLSLHLNKLQKRLKEMVTPFCCYVSDCGKEPDFACKKQDGEELYVCLSHFGQLLDETENEVLILQPIEDDDVIDARAAVKH